jgi:hypothetical protein
MFFMFFPLFGFWWWALTLSILGWIFILEEMEKPGEVCGVLLLYVLLAVFLGDFLSVFKWVAANGAFIGLICAPTYLICGFFWGIFRYWWEQSISLAKYNEAKVDFLTIKRIPNVTPQTEIPENLLEEWASKVGENPSHSYYGANNLRKFFNHQKKRVITWMSWWWLSMISFVCKDFITRFYYIVLNWSRGIFEAIDRRVWGKASTDFERIQQHFENKKNS